MVEERTLVPAADRTRPGAEPASGAVGAASVLLPVHCTASAAGGAGTRGTLGAEGAVGIARTPRSRWRVEAPPAGGEGEGGGGGSRTGRTRSNTGRCAAAACCTRIEI